METATGSGLHARPVASIGSSDGDKSISESSVVSESSQSGRPRNDDASSLPTDSSLELTPAQKKQQEHNRQRALLRPTLKSRTIHTVVSAVGVTPMPAKRMSSFGLDPGDEWNLITPGFSVRRYLSSEINRVPSRIPLYGDRPDEIALGKHMRRIDPITWVVYASLYLLVGFLMSCSFPESVVGPSQAATLLANNGTSLENTERLIRSTLPFGRTALSAFGRSASSIPPVTLQMVLLNLCLFFLTMAVLRYQETVPYPRRRIGKVFEVCTWIGRYMYLTRHGQGFQISHQLCSFLCTALLYAAQQNYVALGDTALWTLAAALRISVFLSIFVAVMNCTVTLLFHVLVLPDREFLIEASYWWQTYGLCMYEYGTLSHSIGLPTAILDLVLAKPVYYQAGVGLVFFTPQLAFASNVLLSVAFTVYYIGMMYTNFRMTGEWPYGICYKFHERGILRGWLPFVVCLSAFLSVLISVVTFALPAISLA